MESRADNARTPDSFLDQLRVLVVNLLHAVRGAPGISYSDVQQLGSQLAGNIIYSDFASYDLPNEQATSFLRDTFVFREVALESDPELLRHRSTHFQLKNLLDSPLRDAQPLEIELMHPSLIASRLLLDHNLVTQSNQQSSVRVVLEYLDELWGHLYFLDADSFARYRLSWELEAMREEEISVLVRRKGCLGAILSPFLPPRYEIPVNELFNYWQGIQEQVEVCRTEATNFAEWLRLVFRLKPRITQFGYMLRLAHPTTDEQRDLHHRLDLDHSEAEIDLINLYVDPELPLGVILQLSLLAARERGLRAGIRELKANYRWHIVFPEVVLNRLISALMKDSSIPSRSTVPSSLSKLSRESLQLTREVETAIEEVLSSLNGGFRKAMAAMSKERTKVLQPIDEFAERQADREASSLSEQLIEVFEFAKATSDTRLLPGFSMGITYEKYKLSAHMTPEGPSVSARSQDLFFSDVLSEYRAYNDTVIEILKSLIIALGELRRRGQLSSTSATLRLPFGREEFQLVLSVQQEGISGAVIEPRSDDSISRQAITLDDDAIRANIVVLATLRDRLIKEQIPIHDPGKFVYAAQIGGPWVEMKFSD